MSAGFVADKQAPPVGLESDSVKHDAPRVYGATASAGGAKSGALEGKTVPEDANLRFLVNRWSNLPETVQEQIVAIVRQHCGE